MTYNVEPQKLTKEVRDSLLDVATEKALAGNSTLLKAFLGHVFDRPAINVARRRILIAVMAVIAGMMLYPPYYYPRDPDSSRGLRHGYGWLMGDGFGRVEVDLLLTQFLAVGILGLIAWVLCADKKS